MTEVARAALLPDLLPPPRGLLLSLSLTWDAVDVPLYPGRGGYEQYAERTQEVVAPLEEVGIVRRFERKVPAPRPDPPEWPNELLLDLSGVTPERARALAESAAAELHRVADERALFVADWITAQVQDALSLCGAGNRAPVAYGMFSHIGSLLPAAANAPQHEAALISTAVQSVSVDPETDLEDVLAFRERNRAEIGRFRASMVDLAASMRRDVPSTAVVEEARAIVKNRVEPALAGLEDALKKSRLRFAWEALFSTSAVALGPISAAVAAERGGQVATRAVAYAFDRDRLVREHPYGYLHRLRDHLGGPAELPSTPPGVPISDPVEEMRRFWRVAAGALVEPVTPDHLLAQFAKRSSR